MGCLGPRCDAGRARGDLRCAPTIQGGARRHALHARPCAAPRTEEGILPNPAALPYPASRRRPPAPATQHHALFVRTWSACCCQCRLSYMRPPRGPARVAVGGPWHAHNIVRGEACRDRIESVGGPGAVHRSTYVRRCTVITWDWRGDPLALGDAPAADGACAQARVARACARNTGYRR